MSDSATPRPAAARSAGRRPPATALPALGTSVAAAGGVVLAWWLLAVVLDARVLPSPWRVFASFGSLLADGMLLHVGASVLRVVASLAVSILLATPLGVVLGRVPRADVAVRPVVYLLYPIPKIALLPVILLLIGIGNGAKVTLLVLVLFFQILVAVRDAVRQIDEEYDVTLRALGGSRVDMLRFVIWPTILPRLLTAVRVGSATALAVLFFAETFFTRFGLGYFIVTQWSRLAYVEMYAGIVTLSGVGVALFACIDLIERRLCPWIRRDGNRS